MSNRNPIGKRGYKLGLKLNPPDNNFNSTKYVYKKVDKRKKIFKLIDKSGQAIEFLPLKAKDLRQWIPNYLLKTGHKINLEALEYIIGIMSMMMQIPLSFIASELEKMTIYAGERKTITINDVLNVMSSITEASVFVMIDALSQRQPEKALSVYKKAISEKTLAVLLTE